jgi:AraC-like DNA-binding protein
MILICPLPKFTLMPSPRKQNSHMGQRDHSNQSVLIPPSLREVLAEMILPSVEANGIEGFLLAQPKMADMYLPANMRALPRKRRGRGHAVRGGKQQVLTRWPADNLISLRLPYCCFVFSGQADFRIGDAILQCTQGHGILIPPGTPLSDGASPHWEREEIQNAESDILWIKFYPFGVECHTCHTRGQQHYGGGFGERSVVSDRQFFVLCELLADEMSYRRDGFQTLSGAYLSAILALLKRHLDKDEALPRQELVQDLAAREELAAARPETTLRRAQSYIENNLGKPLSLQEIARASYISRAKLAVLFREQTSQTVWEYVTERRIEEAKSLLRDTDMAIENVGRLIGFSNLSHFCTRFMKVVGQPPGEFRLQNRKINSTDKQS